MENKKIYLTKITYSLLMGLIMGFVFTSGFFVIIINVDRYFLNSLIGLNRDWIYIVGIILLIPFFGALYIYNKRIVIINNMLEVRESSLFFNASKMDIMTIKNITLHKQVGRRRVKKGIKFTDGESVMMINIKPFNTRTLSNLLMKMLEINPDIIIDDFFK